MSWAVLRLAGETLLVPFATAALATGLLRLVLSGRQSATLIAVAPLLGFLAAHVLLFGPPALPPVMARDKIAWVAVLGTGLGFLLLLMPRWTDVLQTVVLAAPVGLVLWLAWRLPLTFEPLLAGVPLALVGAGVVGPLAAARQRNPRRVLMLLSVVVGIAVIAAYGRSLSLAQLAVALAASLLGVLVAGRSLHLMNATLLGPTGTVLALAGSLALFSEASRIALLLLAAVFAADRVAAGLAPRRLPWLEPVLFAAGCLIPLGLAVAIARADADGLL